MILNKMLSEFQALCTFFEFLSYAKRKYPQSVTYRTKYLTSLINDEKQQEQEVKLFQNFLIQNQKISEMTKKIFSGMNYKNWKKFFFQMENLWKFQKQI
jgi:hypothetical protein